MSTEQQTDQENFVLQPPAPVAVVEAQKAEGMVPLKDTEIAQLDSKVDTYLNELMALEVGSDSFKSKVNSIHSMGLEEIRASAAVSNRMLERPVKSMESGLFNEGSNISKGLVSLRNQVEELDPGSKGDLLAPRKLFGIIPFGNKLRNYFQQYQSAQTHLNSIVESLLSGQDELRKDNAAIEQEKANLWEIMQKLEQYIYLGKKIDAGVEAKLVEIETQNMEKARVVKEDLLFYLRQKIQDLLTQLAVSVQGYLSLDLIRKNNLELIKGVDRATSTTVSALRTAVITAQALTNQKLVLDQISALNTTTSNVIQSTSEMLKNNTATIHEQASSSTVEIDKLKAAFQNIYETMDTIADYKIKALDSMKQTVDVLTTEVEKSKSYLDNARKEQVEQLESGLQDNELKV